MGTVESIYKQFVIYSQNYHSTGILPDAQTLSDFSSKVHGLKVVQEYCSSIDISEMIRANIPFEKLNDYCTIPESLNEEMAQKFLN